MAGKQKKSQTHLRNPEFGDKVIADAIIVPTYSRGNRVHEYRKLDQPVSGKLVSLSYCYDGIVTSDSCDVTGAAYSYFTHKLTHSIAIISVGLRRKLIRVPLKHLKFEDPGVNS
jgi:hypothetical protein